MKAYMVLFLPILIYAVEPKTVTPYDVNATPPIQIVNKQMLPTAENGYYQNHYYYETNDYGTAIVVFGLGHLFNFDRVIEEYRSYFRVEPPRSSKYQYEFDYADTINKQ